ncbi:hypothetical protein ACFL0L_00520 [Patescibacteria group bacterium]
MKTKICIFAAIAAFLCTFVISSPAIAETHDGYSIWTLDDQAVPPADVTVKQFTANSTTPAASNSPPAASHFVSYFTLIQTNPAAFESPYTSITSLNRSGPPASACANCGTDISVPRPADANLFNGFWQPDSDVRDQAEVDTSTCSVSACNTRRYDDINVIPISGPTGAAA